MTVTLSDVKEANPIWFGTGNKSFFGDVNYQVLHGKVSKEPYLVRYTVAWTDMFDQKKKYHYRINPINPDTLKIGSLVDGMFDTLDDVKEWLKNN